MTDPMTTAAEELEARVARLEAWANEFSVCAEHADAPVFVTKAYEDEVNERLAVLRARTQSKKDRPNGR